VLCQLSYAGNARAEIPKPVNLRNAQHSVNSRRGDETMGQAGGHFWPKFYGLERTLVTSAFTGWTILSICVAVNRQVSLAKADLREPALSYTVRIFSSITSTILQIPATRYNKTT
jgi:hypothetical protein